MKLNPEIYSPDHLKPCDKEKLDVIEDVSQRVLDESVIDDFIESKSLGKTMQAMYREMLCDFIAFQKERAEYCKVDLIIEKIDGYSDAEFEQIREEARKRKAAQQLAGSFA